MSDLIIVVASIAFSVGMIVGVMAYKIHKLESELRKKTTPHI